MTDPRRYEDVLDEDLKDPAEAVGYLNACLEDQDPEVFLLALRDVASTECSPRTATPSSAAWRRYSTPWAFGSP
jgi:DNA-binding phage protein